MASNIIGRGTWMDKVAHRVIERDLSLGRDVSLMRVESGLGASGIPHIGSLSDAVRAYGIKLALEDAGHRSELVAFSDDMDGLRKVPAGLPEWLSGHIGEPVSRIPDPFGCHGSYGEHMSSLLMDALDDLGVEYRHMSGAQVYRSGGLVPQARTILSRAEEVGDRIREVTGQDKFTERLPFFAVCEKCGRIYTTVATGYDPSTDTVTYECVGAQIGGRWVPGCGHKGEVKLSSGEGKLSWKVELAARWSALDIRFEAYGKDLEDSIRINDRISDEILGFPHPYHTRYELFLDRSGKKISKSTGNVVTPQAWLRYGTRHSLILLMYKRIVGTRYVSLEDVPKYVDEYDELEDFYFGRRSSIEREEAEEEVEGEGSRGGSPSRDVRLRGLYEYVNFLRPPPSPDIHVPYRLLSELGRAAPEDGVVDFVVERLRRYGILRSAPTPGLVEKIEKARRWALEVEGNAPEYTPTPEEAEAMLELAAAMRSTPDPAAIQNAAFDVARRHGIEPSAFFRALYRSLIGSDRGPRFSSYALDVGVERVASAIEEAASRARGGSRGGGGSRVPPAPPS
ncbi:MAG: lysine--tRNA ligase [Conexivisphaera sp.]|jgi:lysyl-tRNA synthetase class 1